MTRLWRGNTDFSAITSNEAVLRYISKYASEGEVASESYSDIFRRAVNADPEGRPATSIRQLTVSTVAERNYSAQEIMHLLQGSPLYHASRTFRLLNLSDRWVQVGEINSCPIIAQYEKRSGLEDISLYEFAKSYRLANPQPAQEPGQPQRPTFVRRDKDIIVRVVPYLKLVTDDPAAREQYFYYQCKLHVPWVNDIDANLPWDASYEDIYNRSTNNGQLIPDRPPEEFPEPDGDQFPDNQFEHAVIVRDAAMAASRLHPAMARSNQLGLRPIDEVTIWPQYNEEFNESHIRTYFTEYKNSRIQAKDASSDLIPLESMSPAKREVINICQDRIDNPSCSTKRVLVQGKAGTGKSAVIKRICKMLDDVLSLKWFVRTEEPFALGFIYIWVFLARISFWRARNESRCNQKEEKGRQEDSSVVFTHTTRRISGIRF